MSSGRYLFDTSVYIAALREQEFADQLRSRYLRDVPRTYFSSVVVAELLAGAITPGHSKLAAALYEPFERANRVISPTHTVWKKAGDTMAALWKRVPGMRAKLTAGLFNDVLIAVTGQSVGATVVTRNRGDFELIRKVVPFRLEIL